MKGGEVMTDRDDFAVRELPVRLALTLIDTSHFLNGSMLGAGATQTAPIDQGTTAGSTTSDPTIANVMSSVDAARQTAAASLAAPRRRTSIRRARRATQRPRSGDRRCGREVTPASAVC